MIPEQCEECGAFSGFHTLTCSKWVLAKIGQGPGTELKRILSEIGIKSGNCNCNSTAVKMNKWGPSECREHMEEIVSSLVKEANKRGWMKFIPMKEFWAEALVNQAIEASEKPTS